MPRYTDAIKWIAYNDEPLDTNIESVKDSISVHLIADLWHKSSYDVAYDVISLRGGDMRLRFYRALQKVKSSI